MPAQIAFFEDMNGTKPLSKDFGIGIIGKERTIYIKNIGDTWLRNVVIDTNFEHMKGLEIFELAPGEIKPAIQWHPPRGIDEGSFDGNVTVKAVSYMK